MGSAERHRRISELLPWYVNGTLDASESAAVDEHILDCEECSRDVTMLRETATAMKRETVVPLPRRALYRGTQATARRRLPDNTLKATAIAATLVLAVVAGVALFPTDSSEVNYRTVTDSGAASSIDYVVAVEMAPGTSRDEADAVFVELGARSVAEPRSGSTYRVVLSSRSASLDEVTELQARVESHASVVRASVVGVELPARAR